MADNYHIKEIRSVVGDWFCVTADREEDRWFIERVIAWALIEAEGKIDHVKAILTDGLPNLDEGDTYYVASADMGFLGISWGEVYRQAVSNGAFVREITHLVSDKLKSGSI
jgi:hypothetical protein